MTSSLATLLLAAICILSAGCGNRSQSAASVDSASPAASPAGPLSQVSAADKGAIRAALENHLRGNRGLNLDAMDMVVDSITIQGDRAQARASFHVKSGGATGMTMQYFLQRNGNGWVVTNGQPADGNTQLPPSPNSQPGPTKTESTPAMPDVETFFKDHPAPKPN